MTVENVDRMGTHSSERMIAATGLSYMTAAMRGIVLVAFFATASVCGPLRVDTRRLADRAGGRGDVEGQGAMIAARPMGRRSAARFDAACAGWRYDPARDDLPSGHAVNIGRSR